MERKATVQNYTWNSDVFTGTLSVSLFLSRPYLSLSLSHSPHSPCERARVCVSVSLAPSLTARYIGAAAARPARAQQQRKCLGCSFLNAPGAKICSRCASRMCNPCPACGKVMDMGYDCYGCGYTEPRSMHGGASYSAPWYMLRSMGLRIFPLNLPSLCTETYSLAGAGSRLRRALTGKGRRRRRLCLRLASAWAAHSSTVRGRRFAPAACRG